MTDKVLEEMISQYLDMCTTQASFSWQGGEPLLAGLGFYKQAVGLQERFGRGHVVSNAFQTNGIRLTDAWAKFFRKYKFLIGISLDGPQFIHDHYRRGPSGQRTFDGVMRGIEILKAGNVDFNVLCVVNDLSVKHPSEIYDFFTEQGIRYLQFVPCLEWEEGTNSPASFSVGAEEYGEFLCCIFDLWKRDFPDVYIRMFNSVLSSRMGLGHDLCTFGPACGEYVVVEHNGDVYPCDFFVERRTLLGNIMESPLRKIVESTALLEFSKRKSKLPKVCKECRWLDQCFGGCQYHRKGANHPQNTFFCSSYRRFFKHSEEGFRELEGRL